jgi:radical SAM protein with 4Fe4S-binding SPASM domain
MSEQLWQAVVPFAKQAGHANIGGYGEPLLNPRCLDYLRELDREGVHTTLTTNGTLVTPAITAELAALAHLDSVNVSIDSPDPALYKAIRGGLVEKALTGVAHLAAALRPSQVTVSSVMMRTSIESLMTFPARLAALGVRTYVLQGLVDYTPGLEPEETRWRDGLAADVTRLREACDRAGLNLVLELPERVAAEMRDPADLLERPVAHQPPSETDTKQCFAPWDVPVIDKDGRVFPCCYALSNAAAVMGDLNEAGADDIWQGERFETFRTGIVDGRTMPDICRSCTVVPTGPHPLRQYAVRLLPEQSTLEGGVELCLAVRNAGASTWTADDKILIGTANPRDGHSSYYIPNWIGRNRICSFEEAAVPPGGIATFRFRIAPSEQAAEESFQLVVENQCWVPGTRFQVRGGVRGRPGYYGLQC